MENYYDGSVPYNKGCIDRSSDRFSNTFSKAIKYHLSSQSAKQLLESFVNFYWVLRLKQPYIPQQKYQSPGTEFECHFQQANICITEFKTVLFHSELQSLCQHNPIHLSRNAVLPHQVVVSNGFSAGMGLLMISNDDRSLRCPHFFPFRGIIYFAVFSALLRLFLNFTLRY